MTNSLDPDQVRNFWVQSVYSGYQQTTLVGKGLTPIMQDFFVLHSYILIKSTSICHKLEVFLSIGHHMIVSGFGFVA